MSRTRFLDSEEILDAEGWRRAQRAYEGRVRTAGAVSRGSELAWEELGTGERLRWWETAKAARP